MACSQLSSPSSPPLLYGLSGPWPAVHASLYKSTRVGVWMTTIVHVLLACCGAAVCVRAAEWLGARSKRSP